MKKVIKLLELTSGWGEILRGILTEPQNNTSNYLVLMLGGFERPASTEVKFKKLADILAEENIASLRVDVAGCGLSDGDFYNLTVEKLAADVLALIPQLENFGYYKFSAIGHSLAGAVIASTLAKISWEKIILLAPALNQKELLRYWFTQKNNQELKITWQNYRQYLQSDDFLADIKKDMLGKSHLLNYQYRYGNQDKDYCSAYQKIANNRVMLVHGDNDYRVPVESLNYDFSNKIMISQGDHDLEKPAFIEQWLKPAADFLKI